jgi:hypothetical protein
MKRFFIIFMLLIIVLGISIPYVTGKFVEGHLQQFETAVMNTDGLQLVGTPHQQTIGWNNSQSESNVKIIALDGQVKIEQQINHGFLPFKPVELSTKLHPDAVLKNTFNDLFGNELSIEAITQIDLNGKSNTLFHQTNGGLKGTLNVDPRNRFISGTLQAPRLKLPPPLYLFELNEGNYRFNFQHKEERISTQFEATLQNLIFSKQFNAQKIVFHSEMNSSGYMLHQFAWDLKSDQFIMNNKDWGKFQMIINGRNFDLSSFVKLRELLKVPPFQQRLMFPIILLQEAPAFLQKLPVFQIKTFGLETPEGNLTLTGNFEMTTPHNAQANSLNILFKNVRATWDCKISEKLLRQWLGASGNKNSDEVDKILKNIENKHRLVKKGEDFVMSLRVENGEALLNDQPLTLRDLKL